MTSVTEIPSTIPSTLSGGSGTLPAVSTAAPSSGLTIVRSIDEFNSFVSSNDKKLVVTHFEAPWAPQCQQVNDALVDLRAESLMSSVLFLTVEAEALPELSMRFNITAVPTVVLLLAGKETARVNGVNVAEMTRLVRQYAPPPLISQSLDPSVSQKQGLNDRLKQLVNSAPVMVFMKGSPDNPQCGFSKTLMQILNDQKVVFKTFDILKDETVRQGLKEYSNWPTYPQVYASGELIGGLDIVKELVASGELRTLLPAPPRPPQGTEERVGGPGGGEGVSKGEGLEERLRGLVRREPVMLFMKGSPSAPKCGFSKTIAAILNGTGVAYGHFDILLDDEVRQGLKTFSNWPTFPQLYVNGALIGGVDIVKELQEAGELDALLRGTQPL